MSAADDPKTQIQASPSASPTPAADPVAVETAPVAAPVKKRRPRMAPETYNKITAWLDAFLIALVLAFAFLSASFAVRNSDFFQYLATGRLIAHGQYEFGKDPFSYVTAGERWVNHSWVYSLFLYLIYSAGPAGGTALVVLKGLAVAALAGVMLAASRNPGQRWLIPAACTAVAVLALSARLYLQPIIVSYLFLGLTLLVLRWPDLRAADGAAPRSYWNYWLLVPLFVLWVNCDQWFFLGPVTAGLYWLGEYLQDTLATDRNQARPAGQLRTLGYAVLAGAAATLVNPHHVFAWTLPPQLGLSAAAAAVAKDKVGLEQLFLSPLDKDYWAATHGLSASGIAFFVLLIAGIASFVLSYNTLRYWRAFLFLAFGVLSIYHARAIPFFAVVAGPITALNFLDYAAGLFGGVAEPDRHREGWAVGRAAALVAAVALVVCSIPGWTQAQPYVLRHVAWTVAPDESLVNTCTQMAEWRKAGLVKEDAHWFNTSPDVLNYMSWYCPGERGFLDLRLALFDATAADYVDVRGELLGLKRQENTDNVAPPETWPNLLKQHDADYLIIYYPSSNPTVLFIRLRQLYFDRTGSWTPLYVDGHTLVFAINKDKEAWTRNERLRFDLDAAAFGPDAVQAPRKPPARAAVRHEWYDALWQPAPPLRPAAVDDARMYILYYSELLKYRWSFETQVAYYQQVIARGGMLGGMPMGRLILGNPQAPFLQMFAARQNAAPPAPLYVALRHLRKSLHDNPDDAQTYLALAQIYMTLFWETQEHQRTAKQNFFPVALIRQAQINWALNKAIQLDPELPEAHAAAADWQLRCRDFQQSNVAWDANLPSNFATSFVDTELRHRQEQLRILKQEVAAQKDSGLNPDLVQSREETLKKFEEGVQQLESEVKTRSARYTNQAEGKEVLQRAQLALKEGLGDEALAVLRKASDEEMVVRQGGQQIPLGIILKLKLLLALGEVEEARTYIHEGNRPLLMVSLPEFRVPSYDWFRLLAAAALGDYDEADDALEAMAEQAAKDMTPQYALLQQGAGGKPQEKNIAQANRDMVGLTLGQMMLNDAARVNAPWEIHRHMTPSLSRPRDVYLVGNVVLDLLGLEADFTALRGWLAVEAGDIKAARRHLHKALHAALVPAPALARSAAVGLPAAAPPARAAVPALWTVSDFAPLRSVPLAQMELFFLDNAAAKQH